MNQSPRSTAALGSGRIVPRTPPAAAGGQPAERGPGDARRRPSLCSMPVAISFSEWIRPTSALFYLVQVAVPLVCIRLVSGPLRHRPDAVALGADLAITAALVAVLLEPSATVSGTASVLTIKTGAVHRAADAQLARRPRQRRERGGPRFHLSRLAAAGAAREPQGRDDSVSDLRAEGVGRDGARPDAARRQRLLRPIERPHRGAAGQVRRV